MEAPNATGPGPSLSDRPNLLESGKNIPPSLGYEVLDLILSDIQLHNLEDLQEDLKLLPIKKLDLPISNRYLARFLNYAASISREAEARVIIEFWQASNSMEKAKPILTDLFFLREVTDETLLFVVNLYRSPVERPDEERTGRTEDEEEIDAFYHLKRLIQYYPSDEETSSAAQRILQIYGDQPIEVWRNLTAVLENQERVEVVPNLVMKEFVLTTISEISEFAHKPPWVKDFGLGERRAGLDLPLLTELRVSPQSRPLFALPSDAEIASLLVGEKESQSLVGERSGQTRDQPGVLEDQSLEEEKANIRREMASLTPQEKKRLIWPLLLARSRYNNSENQEIFRILGPANVMYNANLSSDHRCSRYGGCRMFTCLCLENWDLEDGVIDERLDEHLPETSVDWFEGYCHFCRSRIRNRAYAVRRPSPMGGWMGCFCSWNHVVQSIPPVERVDESGSTIAQYFVIQTIIKQMEEIGIQDRLIDPKNPDAPIPVEDEYLPPLREVPVVFEETGSLPE